MDTKTMPDYRKCGLKPNTDRGKEELGEHTVEFLEYCKKILRKEDISLSDNLRNIGVDSLTIYQLIAFVEERWNVDISYAEMISCMKLSDIVSCIQPALKKDKESKVNAEITKRKEVSVSSIQKIILENESNQEWDILKDNLIYLVKTDFIMGEEKFRKALGQVVDESDMMHTTFHLKNGRYVMRYEDECSGYFTFIQSNGKIDDMDYTTILESFDCHKLPLFHIYLIQDMENEQRILLHFSHLIFDYYSLHILLSNFFKYYKGTIPHQNEGVGILEHLDKQQIKEQKKEKQYWKRVLYKHADVICFPSDTDAKKLFVRKDDHYTTLKFEIEDRLYVQIQEMCNANNVMEFVVFKTALIFLLYKWQKKKDIIIGIMLAGRNSPEEYSNIGVFAKLVPSRHVISEESTLWENILQFQSEFFETVENATLYIDEIYQCMDLADMIKGELFQIIMNFTSGNISSQVIEVKKLSQNLAKIPISINCISYNDKINFEWIYVDRLYTKTRMKEIIKEYTEIIRDICLMDIRASSLLEN